MAVATVDTALALSDAGVDVILFAEGQAELPPRAAPLGDRVVRMAPRPKALERPRVEAALFLPGKLGLSRRWAKALAAHPVDVVHAFSPGTAMALPRPLPVVVQAWFHPPRLPARLRTMMGFARRSPPLYAAHLALELQSHASDLLGYRRADLVLANTVAAERAFRDRGIEARQVPPSIAVPDELPDREPWEGLRVAFCAERLETPRKGLTHLLDALPLTEARPLAVTLFGQPSARFDDQIAAARSAGVEVTVAGRVPRERYLDELGRRTDLLAFPSLYEEWGYALIEGFSRGVPAVVFDLYPFSEIVSADTGSLVPPRDARALATALDRVAAGELPAPRTVVESARERYGSEAVVRRLIPMYEELARR